MERLSKKMKEEAVNDLEMYFGKPPYDIEHVMSCHSSGLFEQQALAKYGLTPVELIKTLQEQENHLVDDVKKEAIKDLKMYFGEPPVPRCTIENRLSSGLLEMQVLAKYSLTVNDLIKEVGFEIAP
jgi:hypothetical protein